MKIITGQKTMKYSRVITAALLFNFSLVFTGCDNSATETAVPEDEYARPAKIVPVVSAGVTAWRTYPGVLEASRRAELAFRVDGQLIDRPAKPGLMVKKGDMLAQLDEAVYRNTFEERQARHHLAKIQYDQASKLVKQKLYSQLQYDQAIAELKSARASLDQASNNLEYTRLLAPFDGVVAKVTVENYQAIKAKTPIIHLQDETQLDIHFSVPERLISQLKKIEDPTLVRSYCGSVRFSSHPGKSYSACYKEHETFPDPLTRNYTIVFTLDPITDFTALPGMTVTIGLDFSTFLPESLTTGLLVPLEAVFEKSGKKWVWQVDSGMRARQVGVEVGDFQEDKIAISQGLSKGDSIIAAGVSYIREGMLVKPLVKERGL